MKTRFTWLGVVAACILTFTALLIGCSGDMNDVVLYRGQVVYINTTNPFPDLTVKVTNGRDTHCQTQTDGGGLFSLKVRVNEIDGSYYLLAGDETCVPKKVALGGYGQAEVDLGVIEVEGPAVPTVKTTPLTEVTAESATLGGEVMTDGRMAVTARGICYGTEQQPTVEGTHTTDGSGLGAFTTTLKNLEHNTIYYARAYATNKMGTAYGEQVKFTTNTGLPIVTTKTISDIRATSAVGNATIDSNGYIVTGCGLCWSAFNTAPTIEDMHSSEIVNNSFSSKITNLTPNTTYYCRAYATNGNGISYGKTVTFTTLLGLATVTTLDVSSFTETSVKTGGKITDDGDFAITERGVCWSVNPNPTIYDYKTLDGQGVGSFTSTITEIDLTSKGNVYYIRAYATNESGTAYGNEVVISYQHYDYERLPRVEYNGYVYVLFYDIGEMNWAKAKQACENLVFAGYDDWTLMPPDEKIVKAIMKGCKEGWMKPDGSPFTFISEENAIYAEGGMPDDFPYPPGEYWVDDSSTSKQGITARYRANTLYSCSECKRGWQSTDDLYYYYETPAVDRGLMKYYDVRVRPIRCYKKDFDF